MRIAFAGFRHPHILSLYRDAQKAENVEIVGCFEEDADVRASLARDEGIVCTYPTYAALLADARADAVAVGDCYGVRGSRITDALRHGKHVLCDKPICTRPEELDEIERLCGREHLLVRCMLDLRYLPQVETARQMLRGGYLGAIHAVSFSGQHPLCEDTRPSWYFEGDLHGGTINDLAIHGVDLVRCLCQTRAALSRLRAVHGADGSGRADGRRLLLRAVMRIRHADILGIPLLVREGYAALSLHRPASVSLPRSRGNTGLSRTAVQHGGGFRR